MPLTSTPVHFEVELVRGDNTKEKVVVRASTEPDIAIWKRDWQPLLDGPEKTWPWESHVPRALSESDRQCLTVESAHGIEALISLTTTTSKTDAGQQVVYVEYVGVAPWNIATPAHPVRRFKGLGTLLLETAAGLAREVVGQPRVGLHSKETALEFYRRTRWLNELGPMSPTTAFGYILKGAGRRTNRDDAQRTPSNDGSACRRPWRGGSC